MHVALSLSTWHPVCVHKGIIFDQKAREERETLNVQVLVFLLMDLSLAVFVIQL
jgi:hypothetical protein